MKEIKIIAWDKDEKKMYQVVQINKAMLGVCEQDYVKVVGLDVDITNELNPAIITLFNYTLYTKVE